MPRLLNTRELAAMTGVTPTTVRTWLRNQWIPGRRVGRAWLLSEDAVAASLDTPVRALLDDEEED